MQLQDFFNAAGGGLADSVKIVFFKMLPRPAQIDKVRAEINRTLLKKYGRLTRLEIDRTQRTITVELDLKGEKTSVQIRLTNYRTFISIPPVYVNRSFLVGRMVVTTNSLR